MAWVGDHRGVQLHARGGAVVVEDDGAGACQLVGVVHVGVFHAPAVGVAHHLA